MIAMQDMRTGKLAGLLLRSSGVAPIRARVVQAAHLRRNMIASQDMRTGTLAGLLPRSSGVAPIGERAVQKSHLIAIRAGSGCKCGESRRSSIAVSMHR